LKLLLPELPYSKFLAQNECVVKWLTAFVIVRIEPFDVLLRRNLAATRWASRLPGQNEWDLWRAEIRLQERILSFSDSHGKAALMLCEGLVHLLLEQHVITKEKALEMIEGVADLVRETEDNLRSAKSRAAHPDVGGLIDSIAQSIEASD
jgi:hypothetical protein